MILGVMKRPRQRRLIDQEIVDEQLPADIDRNHRRRIGEIRGRDRMRVGVLEARRPRRAEDDAVVERGAARRLCVNAPAEWREEGAGRSAAEK